MLELPLALILFISWASQRISCLQKSLSTSSTFNWDFTKPHLSMIQYVAVCSSQTHAEKQSCHHYKTLPAQHTDLETPTLLNILYEYISSFPWNFSLSSSLMYLAQASSLPAIMVSDTHYFPLWFLADNFHFQIPLWRISEEEIIQLLSLLKDASILFHLLLTLHVRAIQVTILSDPQALSSTVCLMWCTPAALLPNPTSWLAWSSTELLQLFTRW